MENNKNRTPSVPHPSANSDGTEYWKMTLSELKDKDDIVLIHVCDENRQTTKDFCCKRSILVCYMKYFEGFLAENENGYDDIDISVHCDVDIFEWLMYYIHSPDRPPPFDKCLVISILISSDFLQMVSLVDLCLKFVSQNLTDIIKLPIDLSCISEKLLNKLSVLTPSSVLANTTDRKDKILNKLYKRRVELDFSRKSGPRSSIASSLTCCRSCHTMYLENYSTSLVCRKAEAVINFRGKPVRRHFAVNGWSLTSYLKSLHSHGLRWESIYWHVWGACTLFRINNEVVFGAAEAYRYNVLEDGLSINTQVFVDEKNSDVKSGDTDMCDGINGISSGHQILPFSLHREDDFDSYVGSDLILKVDENMNSMDDEAYDTTGLVLSGGVINRDNLQSGLNPIRKIDILPLDIFLLIKSQQALISGEDHKATIANVCRQQTDNRASGGNQDSLIEHFDFSQVLFGGKVPSKAPRQGSNRDLSGGMESDEPSRGRSRSRSQHNKSTNLSASANLDDGSQERTSVDTSNGHNNLRSRSMSGGPTRRTSSNASGAPGGQGVAQGSLRKLASSSAVQTSTSNNNTNTNTNKPPLNTTSAPPPSNTSGSGSSSLSTPRSATDEEESTNMFATLGSIPPEVRSYFSGKLGPIDGIWLNAHPLTLLPPSYYKIVSNIQAVSSKDLPPNKRSEWELDLLREYDDTRMGKYEEFLVKCRKNPEKQMDKFITKPNNNTTSRKDPKDAAKRRANSKRDLQSQKSSCI